MPEKMIALLYSNLSGNEKKILKKMPKKSGGWLYFGKDYRNLKRVELYLGCNFKLIEISKKLDEISGFLRGDYQNYIDKINKINKDSFEWWFTPLSSRNIYMSEVFQNICYLQLLKDLYEKHEEDIVLIVVESYSAGRIIEEWARENEIPIKPVSRPYNGKIRTFARASYAIVKTTAKTLINCVFAVISGMKVGRKNIISVFKDAKRTALIDVFIYESNFGEDGSFNDRYFPGLETFLKKDDCNVIYHPKFAETKLNKYRLYRKIRENERFFVIAEDYLRFSDYIRSLIMSVKAVTFSGKIPEFIDYDISFADECENKWKCFDGIFKSILIYHLFLRLESIIGDNIERIISWHENQLQDKALSLAIHESFKNTKIVGVHHLIHYSNYLSFYPVDSEAKASLIPDIILTTGVLESTKLRKYLSMVPVNESAALRYSSLFNTESRRTVLQSGDILLLLPYDRNDAFELLIRVGRILSSLDIVSNVLVKCHPDYGKEIFSGIFENFESSDKMIFTEKKPDELFNSVSVVISTASGSIVEAAVSGVPTILLSKSNALGLNPFDLVDYPFISVCYDSDSLVEAVLESLLYSAEEIDGFVFLGNKLKEQIFNPVNDETLKIFEQ
ncbi:MAG: hypothetical protein JXQ82_09305 [Methanomicrobiaceae archaeon]|nr:hypothetical protein [Methanomicrobiaceae archaeon]